MSDEEPLPPYVYGFVDEEGERGVRAPGPREAGAVETHSWVETVEEEGVDEEGESVSKSVQKEKSGEVRLLGARSTAAAGGGLGKASFPNGDEYVGQYADGARHGAGKYTYNGGGAAEDGEEAPAAKGVYEGPWVGGVKEGAEGVLTYAEVEVRKEGVSKEAEPKRVAPKYHGGWRGGRREGEGAMFYANGNIYTGEWLAGKKHGHGTYLHVASGARLVGTWREGAIASGTLTDAHGGVYEGPFTAPQACETPGTTPFAATQCGYGAGRFTLPSGALAPMPGAATSG